MSKPSTRRRSSSVTNALRQIPLNHQEGPSSSVEPTDSTAGAPSSGWAPTSREVKPLPGRPRSRAAKKLHADALPEYYDSRGFWDDLKTGRWMLVPSSAAKILLVPIVLYLNHRVLTQYGILEPSTPNPFAPLVTLSHRLPNGSYTKGWNDLLFIANSIVFWSLVRQFVTIHILRPLATMLGIKGSKIMRFTEQGYAVVYFSIMGTMGIWVMNELPTWWFRTRYFWTTYPVKEMTLGLKAYYLLQFGYWLQQTIILAAKIEKPRKDFKELVAHHAVSLWLIGWSFLTYSTYIGVCVFITMDVSDVFLGLAKCVNYVDETLSIPFFAFFVAVWTYLRHYLNWWLLYSVWFEWKLIPEAERQGFSPLEDKWMAPWIQYQIFIPIALLQLINLYWYALIIRILWRAIFAPTEIKDDRSDDEDEAEAEPSTEEKVKMLKGEKAE